MNKIIYENFAPGAAENAAVSAPNDTFCYIGDIKTEVPVVNYATLENQGIDLTDTTLCFAREADNVGFVSQNVSTSAGDFAEASLLIELSGCYTGPGITLVFHGHYATKVNVTYYRDNTVIFKQDYFPNTLDFFCPAEVEAYTAIKITFLHSEISYQFVKLDTIKFGVERTITEFFGNINVFEEISIDSTDIPGDTCDFEALIPNSLKPQSGQAFFFFHKGELVGKFIVEKAVNNGNDRYSFEACDEKSILGNMSFPRKTRQTIPVADFLDEMKAISNIEIDGGDFSSDSVTGFVEDNKSCRYALCMLCFAGGYLCSGARSKKLKLFEMKNERDKLITGDEICGKAEYTENQPFTKISLATYSGNGFDDPVFSSESNTKVTSNIAENIYKLDKFSLAKAVANAEGEKLSELADLGFLRNEIKATVILSNHDIRVGDIVKIETNFGIKTGIVKSLDISFTSADAAAKVTIIETGANYG